MLKGIFQVEMTLVSNVKTYKNIKHPGKKIQLIYSHLEYSNTVIVLCKSL